MLGLSCGTWDLHCGMRELLLCICFFVVRGRLSSCDTQSPEHVGSVVVCGLSHCGEQVD